MILLFSKLCIIYRIDGFRAKNVQRVIFSCFFNDIAEMNVKFKIIAITLLTCIIAGTSSAAAAGFESNLEDCTTDDIADFLDGELVDITISKDHTAFLVTFHVIHLFLQLTQIMPVIISLTEGDVLAPAAFHCAIGIFLHPYIFIRCNYPDNIGIFFLIF